MNINQKGGVPGNLPGRTRGTDIFSRKGFFSLGGIEGFILDVWDSSGTIVGQNAIKYKKGYEANS